MVRIYITEGAGIMKNMLKRLHDQEQVCGVTVFRGISGFGRSGEMHSSGLLDLSLDLPLVVEFFDEPAKAQRIMDDLSDMVAPGHMVSWNANVNL